MATNKQLTLLQLNSLVKASIQSSFPESIWIVAEIGELKLNRTGHCYIELVEKDSNSDEIVARMRATIWAWQFRFIQPYFESTTGQALSSGIKVLASGNLAFHESYGLSVNINDIDPSYTLGDMARKRKEAIDKLTADGIIDMNKELDFPDIPSRIAIVSSPTSAGYEDFMNQLHNNIHAYSFHTQLFEASIQGTKAAQSIIDALDEIFNIEDHFDLVVIIRGGGSQMDLNCFDDYELAYHVAQFPLPVLTGIGHEKDESLTDIVAFKKLKTPTAVAEFLIEKMDYVNETILSFEAELRNLTEDIFLNQKNRINQSLRLFKPIIKSGIERAQMQVHRITGKLKPGVNEVIDNQKNKLSTSAHQINYSALLLLGKYSTTINTQRNRIDFLSKTNISKTIQSIENIKSKATTIAVKQMNGELSKINWLEKNTKILDPKSILKRGFSITLKNGKAIKTSSQLNSGDIVETILYKGKIHSEIKNLDK